MTGCLIRLHVPCLLPQPSYTEEDAYGDHSDFEDSEAERRAAVAKAKDLIPAFMNSHEGLDDEVERILGHRCVTPFCRFCRPFRRILPSLLPLLPVAHGSVIGGTSAAAMRVAMHLKVCVAHCACLAMLPSG